MSSHQINISQATLDPDTCRRARISRDPRFDGEFFLGVSTTGIYCRPICPARAPAEKNVSYFRHAAVAAQAGFRPCLRCRPESAPQSPAWLGTATTVQRALKLIEAGALNEGTLAQLADRLGVGERYLRKLFSRELGTSPTAVASNQRLLFAKKLLVETSMSHTEIAYAAGFGSVRRFNSTIRQAFDRTPGQLRKHQRVSRPGAGIRLQLQYRPPYDWEGVLNLFRRHALAGVEEVTDSSYQRSFDSSGQPANFTVTRARGRDALEVRLQLPHNTHLMPVVARIRRMFDLDANPAAISQVLGQSEPLRKLLEQHPGIRAPVHFSPFESAIRAVVGQQVSVAAARNVCARLADACKTQCIGFPTAAALACLADEHFSMPTRRRDTLRTLCSHYTNAEQSLDMETLASFKGIGPWTCTMVAMRGFGDPDVFALGDLGLQQAWSACFVDSDEEDLASAVTHWRPWRSYAANLLWRSLGS